MEHGQQSATSGADGGSSGLRETPGRWLVANGLYVEAAIVGVAVALAVVSLLVLFVAAILSMPMGPPPESGTGGGGATPLADLGTVLFNGGILVTMGLGLVLVVHALVELSVAVSSGRGLDLGEPTDLAYAAVRVLQTVGAVAFAGTVAGGFVLARLGVIPNDIGPTLGAVVLAAGGTMVGSVVVHGLGRGVRLVADGW